jgi:ABC-2 type transport system permease protein
VNLEHLKTYIWLRWRLSVNQVRRGGPVGAIIAAILAALRIFGGFLTFAAGLLIGMFALQQAAPRVVMVVWDIFVGGFLFFWLIGLMSELHSTELLSLDSFMHLPVSLAGAFLINYAGSSFGLSLVLFLPAMLGLGIGLMFSQGPGMLLLFPLIAAFFLMITAVTFQFRGWLASMMANPRRRRTIIAVITLLFVMIFQIPNFMNNLGTGASARKEAWRKENKQFELLKKDFAEGRITKQEYDKRLTERGAAWQAARKLESEKNYEMTWMVNRVIPPGWLPYGAATAAQGKILPALAAFACMALIGLASLWRAYRTTIRLYLGEFNTGRDGGKIRTEAASKVSSKTGGDIRGKPTFLEQRLPWISDQASAICLACFRALVRAPEVKMMLLTPVIMLGVFSGTIIRGGSEVPVMARPLVALGMAAFILIIGMTGFLANQFAYDRGGFRAFVLSCAPRRDILLGKNLSLSPFAFIFMVIVIGVMQWMRPMRPEHLAAVVFQTIPIYLMFCLAGNMLSIFSPVTLKPGSGQPARHQGVRVLYQIVFMLVVPALMSLTLIPLGIEALFAFLNLAAWFPTFLVLSIIQAAVMLWVYRIALDWQGAFLQKQELKILEVVSLKVE